MQPSSVKDERIKEPAEGEDGERAAACGSLSRYRLRTELLTEVLKQTCPRKKGRRRVGARPHPVRKLKIGDERSGKGAHIALVWRSPFYGHRITFCGVPITLSKKLVVWIAKPISRTMVLAFGSYIQTNTKRPDSLLKSRSYQFSTDRYKVQVVSSARFRISCALARRGLHSKNAIHGRPVTM